MTPEAQTDEKQEVETLELPSTEVYHKPMTKLYRSFSSSIPHLGVKLVILGCQNRPKTLSVTYISHSFFFGGRAQV